MKATKKFPTAALLTAELTLTACAPTSAPGTASEALNIGIVHANKTGPLTAYSYACYEGLQAGLGYAAEPTNKVGDTALNITYHDDGGDPDRAVTVAKEITGKDYKILVGAAFSGIALQLAGQSEQGSEVDRYENSRLGCLTADSGFERWNCLPGSWDRGRCHPCRV